ncbi:hypothetical protein K8I61_06760 [bacterium]|nr:hypothetical protein [bacterium]
MNNSKAIFFAALATVFFALAPAAFAQTGVDPYLVAKTADYEDFLRQWHSGGMGGVSDRIFTDETRTELLRTKGAGDSEDWTGFYLVTQAMRYAVTGAADARAEVLRIAEYLHHVHKVTGDPGYIARYVAPDEAPWNVEFEGSDNKIPGEGDYAGAFWVGRQSRDKYITWFWSQTWAHDLVDDAAMRATIEADFREVIDTLVANNWTIIDPWGDTWPASSIGHDIRLSIILQVAHVTGDPAYWALLDSEYEKVKNLMWFSTFTFFNKYFEYFAFINNHPVWNAIHRLWPDRERLEHLNRIFNVNVRSMVEGTHAALFDAIYIQTCLRLGDCDQDELDAIADDIEHGLTVFWDPPNYKRHVDCSVLPLDPFSVWADNFLSQYPWLEDIFDIDPQTAEAHEVDDRCWTSHLWERSPYHIACSEADTPTETGPSLDYLLSYWYAVYYGILGDAGPLGDDDLTGDDDDDDDSADDDSADDDTVDDDTDDDATDDDSDDDDDSTDDDSVSDDDAADDDTSDDDDAADDDAGDDDATDDDDNDDDDGCGC